MVAVLTDFQGRGIGSALIEFAPCWMKDAGMPVAMVETGGVTGHQRARHTYEKVGFELWPVARYFKKLGSADVLISLGHCILQLNVIARSFL
jgi:GNAT superfamily N-acetyltransferase